MHVLICPHHCQPAGQPWIMHDLLACAMQDWQPIKRQPPVGQSSESLGAPPPSEAPPLPAPSVEPHASRPAVEDSQLLGMPPHSQVLEFDQTLEQDMEEAFAKVTEKGANTSKSMDDSIFSNPLTLPDQSQSAYPTSMCNKEPRVYTSTFTCLIN